MADRIRTRIHTISDDAYLITLVPLYDNIVPPDPLTKAYIDSCLINGQYAVLDTNTFNILMGLGVAPNWNKDSRNSKPIVWNAATQKNYYVARLVADARFDEIVSNIDGNIYNLRYINLEKKQKSSTPPDRRDREDIVRSDNGVEPVKDIKDHNAYANYSMPAFQYQ
jgi:hypothetical protein